jgi:sialate O-acetylesterase
MRKLSLSVSAALLFLAGMASANVKLPALFTDGLVLQQGKPVPVWGWADDGEKVTVKIAGKQASAVATGGKWMLKLPAMKAGGPMPMTVTGNNTIALPNVYVGEVWIASGQSNMQMGLDGTIGSKEAIESSNNPMLRLFTVPNVRSDKPLDDVNGKWVQAGPDNVRWFSAVAYYFARDLQQALKVPVGIIHTSWGGSPAEVWMSRRVLDADPEYKQMVAAAPAQLEAWKAAYAKFQTDLPGIKEKDAADIAAAEEKAKSMTPEAGQKLVSDARNAAFWREQPPWQPWTPAELYNGMIAPLIPYAIQGAIWYQGESNAGRAFQYRRLFVDMIENWRQDWGEGNFTFLSVQLAPFTAILPQPADSDWAELREAQLMSTKALPNVGMAVITDVGNETDIHPKDKAPVGARLALAALGIEYSGPIYKSMQVTGDKIVLSFTHVGQGLISKGGRLTGFAICGPDHKFVWASARIVGDTVVVESHLVKNPVAVRYGWANYPVVNLWNKDGLPATSFRTDDFQMVTGPKK